MIIHAIPFRRRLHRNEINTLSTKVVLHARSSTFWNRATVSRGNNIMIFQRSVRLSQTLDQVLSSKNSSKRLLSQRTVISQKLSKDFEMCQALITASGAMNVSYG